MLNSRVKWVMALLVLFLITLSCSKKEEETGDEGASQETPAEQKSTMIGQERERAGAETEEVRTTEAAAGAAGMAEESGETASDRLGKEIYQRTCSACHDTGVAGAPKTGDTEAWNSRIAKGEDLMVKNAINGIGAMPPKGGNPSLSEEEVRAAVMYMIEQSR